MRELHRWVLAKGYIPACLFSPPLDMCSIHSKVSTSCGKSNAFHSSLYLPRSHKSPIYTVLDQDIILIIPRERPPCLGSEGSSPIYAHTYAPMPSAIFSILIFSPLPRLPQQNFNPTRNSIASTSQKPILAPSTAFPTQLHRPQTAPHPSRESTSGPRLARPQHPP